MICQQRQQLLQGLFFEMYRGHSPEIFRTVYVVMEGDWMALSDKVKGLLALCGKRQIDLAAYFGMSKQTMGNKMSRNSWSGNDLAKAAEFCGCKLAFLMPDGQQIIIEPEVKEEK